MTVGGDCNQDTNVRPGAHVLAGKVRDGHGWSDGGEGVAGMPFDGKSPEGFGCRETSGGRVRCDSNVSSVSHVSDQCAIALSEGSPAPAGQRKSYAEAVKDALNSETCCLSPSPPDAPPAPRPKEELDCNWVLLDETDDTSALTHTHPIIASYSVEEEIRRGITGVAAEVPNCGESSENPCEEWDTSPIPVTARFVDYAPQVFKRLRRWFSIDEDEYREAFSVTLKEFPSPGKGRSSFFQTSNARFLLKGISLYELQFFCNFFKDYAEHMMTAARGSLLTRFYGLHEVTGEGMTGLSQYYVVMGSAFPTSAHITECFDLKGSTANRFVTDAQRDAMQGTLGYVCWRDLDWGHRRLELGANRVVFLETVQRDCKFLEDHGIIDYSLLVALHPAVSNRANSSDGEWCSFQCASPDLTSHEYSVAIVDIMQPYDMRKKMETMYKTYLLWQEMEHLSSVSSSLYSGRFFRFMEDLTGCHQEDTIYDRRFHEQTI